MAEQKQPRTKIIRDYFKTYPGVSVPAAAVALSIPAKYIHQIRYMDKRKAKEARASKRLEKEFLKRVASPDTAPTPSVDMVNHPPHYKKGGIETIDFIEAKQLPYNLGNVVKYVTRAEHKGAAVEDLRKAQWYLSREIRRVTNASA